MSEAKNNGNSNIFRQKSLDRVSSPEDLDKYIKTTRPSLWLLLASIIIFLVGVIVWATIGKINTESVVGCSVSSSTITCYVKEENIELLNDDSYLEIDGSKIAIDKAIGPFQAEGSSTILHNSSIEEDDWYYELSGRTALKNGEYKGKAVFEELSPISFVIN